jgi:PAS domain S-box-containing protein
MPGDTTAQPGTRRVNVLLVDDVPANLLALEAILDGPDRRLVRATSGVEALDRLAAEDFAVVVLDLQMPGLDGFQTAQRIRSLDRTRHTPVIFVTAYDPDEFPISAAYELGAVDYLVKPLVPPILRAKVAVFVDLFRQSARIRELERERAAAALQASEDRFRLIVESATDYAIFTTDLRGVIQTWSTGARNVLGYERGEALGRDIRSLFVPEDVARAVPEREMEKALARGRAEDERWHIRKDGTRFWANGLLFPLRDGEVMGFLKVLRDQTREREAQETSKAESRRKDEFLATLAHELRNPLAPIRTGLQLLQVAQAEDARRRAYEMMERQVLHLVRLVDDLLDVSRVSQGKILLRKDRVDLRAVLGEAVESSRPAIDAARHALTLRVPDETLVVEADRTRLVQVFGNLLNNAAKYTPAGGAIRVEADRAGPEAVVRVRDTGVGIPPEMLPRVFDLFAQAASSLEQSQGGLGIGLTLVQRLVAMHGGTVEAHSDGPGRGSEFVVRLPMTEPGPAAQPRPAVAPALRDGPRRRVLVVEDNVDGAESVRLLLELAGHSVVVAHTGPAGVEAARAFRPEVVLCDLGLPGMTGYDVARALRADPVTADTRLVCVSGFGQEEDRRRAREAGFDETLVKPVAPDELDRVLASGGEV